MRTYRLGLYEKSMPNMLTIPEKLNAARACGFDFLELSIDETDEKLARLDWSDAQLRALMQAQQSAGIPISSICLSGHRKYPLGHPDPEIRRLSLDILRKALRLASGLGARIIQLAGYDVYYESSTTETRSNFKEALYTAAELASAEGVILAFETMETDFLNTVRKAMEWVSLIRSPYLQIYPDSGNLTNAALSSGISVRTDLEAGRGHIVALHLKESRPGQFREVPYGQGHVDFGLIAETAMALGVRRYLAEFWYTGQPQWEQELCSAHQFLKQYLDG